MPEPLPRPTPEMSRKERGLLLARYVREGGAFREKDPVTGKWRTLDFGDSDAQEVDLSGADLMSMNLAGSNLSNTRLNEVNLTGATLNRCILHNTFLRGARLDGARLHDVQMSGADLTGASLVNAHLLRADMEWCLVTDAVLMETYLWGAKLSGWDGKPADRRGAHLDADAYTRSGWTPAQLAEWVFEGAVIEDYENFPVDAQDRLVAETEGLSLHFMGELDELDLLALHNVVAAWREQNPSSDARTASVRLGREQTTVRLVASRSEDLVFLAVALYQRIWDRGRAEPSTTALVQLREEIGAVTHPRLMSRLSWLMERGDRFELWVLEGGRLEQAQTWELTSSPASRLEAMLLDHFTDTELRRFILGLDDGAHLLRDLPGASATPRELASALVSLLQRQGRLDEAFFLRLTQARPRRHVDVVVAAAGFGISLPPRLLNVQQPIFEQVGTAPPALLPSSG